eukprot:433667_1
MSYTLNIELLVFGYIRVSIPKTRNKTLTIPVDIQKLIIGIGFANEILKHLGIICCGSSQSGKTLLCSRLLHKLNGFTRDESNHFNKLEKSQQISDCVKLLNKEKDHLSVDYPGKSQRTINYAIREFFTNNYHYTLLDAPGHRDYIKNFIIAGSTADVGLIVVPANKGSFESSILKGNHYKGELQGEIHHQCRLLYFLGVVQLIVCINKMDCKHVKYRETRFTEIKSEMVKILTRIGYKTKKIPFIPISAWHGDNIFDVSSNMEWYKGFKVKIEKKYLIGHTVFDALDTVINPRRVSKKSILDRPLRMPVLRLYNCPKVCHKAPKNPIIAGHIEQGQIRVGQKVKFIPSGCSGVVKTMKMHYKSIKIAYEGFHIGLGIEFEKFRKYPYVPNKGDVMVIDDKKYDLTTLKTAKYIHMLAFIQYHPGRIFAAELKKIKPKRRMYGYGLKNVKIREEYKGGLTPCLFIRNARIPCQLIKIKWRMGKSTSNMKIEDPSYVEAADQCEIIFRALKPIVALPWDECKPFARCIFMDHNQVLIIGKVVKVEYSE